MKTIVKTGSLSFKLLLSSDIKLISWESDIYKKKLQTLDKIKILSLMYKSPQGLLYMCSRHISFFNSINQSSFIATFTSVARFCKEEPKTQRLGNRWSEPRATQNPICSCSENHKRKLKTAMLSTCRCVTPRVKMATLERLRSTLPLAFFDPLNNYK